MTHANPDPHPGPDCWCDSCNMLDPDDPHPQRTTGDDEVPNDDESYGLLD